MAKTRLVKGQPKTADKQPTIEYFVDVTIPVPESARHLITDPNLKLRYGVGSAELIRMASNSLIVSRRLLEGDSISGGHRYVLELARQIKNRTSKDLQRDVQQIYEGWKNDLRSDVITIAMFAENDLLNTATPYDESDEDDNEPLLPQYKWLPKDQQVKLPEPDRDLSNPFEIRLKQIIDFLAVGGRDFGTLVTEAIDEGILAAYRGLVAETDSANFPAGSVGGDVSGTPGTDGVEGGNSGGRGEIRVLGTPASEVQPNP